MLGRPLTYRWLYYADFLDSQDARNAIVAELSIRVVAIAAACLAGLLGAASVLRLALRFSVNRVGSRRLTIVGIGMSLAYFLVGGIWLHARVWNYQSLANPVFAFASSILPNSRPSSLLTTETSVGFDDFEPPRPIPSLATPDRGSVPIRNVVVFVLESVAAQYLGPYGARYPVTPELDKRSGQSLTFTNIYSPASFTSTSIASLMLSIHPWISQEALTREHPNVRFPSLSSELNHRGYRTAFFNSADLRHMRLNDFLSHREFDRVADYRNLPCQAPVLHANANPLLDSTDDECIVDAFTGWVRSSSPQPFFAVLWTMMSHEPYFVSDREADFGVADSSFNRYLNAIHHSDQMIGKLLESLKAIGLEESTLLVVTGDHGEVFGQHGQRGHGAMYEPSVHVPLILVNASGFHGERSPVVGGLLDIAPTILEVLGLAPPAVWQGRSLFRFDRSGRAYFFTPTSDRLFGLREKDLKVIFDAEENRFEIYDLSRDPDETHNLASRMPAEAAKARQRMAAWVQYQDRMMRGLFQATPVPERHRAGVTASLAP